MNKILNLTVSLSLIGFTVVAKRSFADPAATFVGQRSWKSFPLSASDYKSGYRKTSNINERLSLSYMTAGEMQQKVVSITGFFHRDFDTFADVLGRWDPRSGTRTADRPSLVSFLFIKKISRGVAESVLEREVFLDPGERIVFKNADLERSPTDTELDGAISEMYQNWLRLPIDSDILLVLSQDFRSCEYKSGYIEAYISLVEALLQHGANYYY